MSVYKSQIGRDNVSVGSVERTDDNGQKWSIPFAPDNTDYQKFKADVLAGAELQDADGVPMTPEAATAFIGTLP